MIRLFPLLVLLCGCTFDCHIDCDLSAWTPKPKPKVAPPVAAGAKYEHIDAYLDAEGLIRARAHGWLIRAVESRANGYLYHLRRPLIAESAPLPAEKP